MLSEGDYEYSVSAGGVGPRCENAGPVVLRARFMGIEGEGGMSSVAWWYEDIGRSSLVRLLRLRRRWAKRIYCESRGGP